MPGQSGEFPGVRRDDIGQPEQRDQCRLRLVGQQPVARLGVHHRVEHHRRSPASLAPVAFQQVAQPAAHGVDEFRGAQHADLDGVDERILTHGLELGKQERWFEIHDGADPLGVLREHARDRRIPVDPVRGEGLHVGHGSGAADGIGALDGQHPKPRGCRSGGFVALLYPFELRRGVGVAAVHIAGCGRGRGRGRCGCCG